SEASRGECSVVTPLRWLCWPVRIEARLGGQTEFVQKHASTRRPRSAIASMCGVRVTIEPYWPIAWEGGAAGRICRRLGRRVVMLLLEAGRIGGLSAGGAGGQARQLVLGEIEQPGDRGGEVPAGLRGVRGGRAAPVLLDASDLGAQRLGVGLRPGPSA